MVAFRFGGAELGRLTSSGVRAAGCDVCGGGGAAASAVGAASLRGSSAAEGCSTEWASDTLLLSAGGEGTKSNVRDNRLALRRRAIILDDGRRS